MIIGESAVMLVFVAWFAGWLYVLRRRAVARALMRRYSLLEFFSLSEPRRAYGIILRLQRRGDEISLRTGEAVLARLKEEDLIQDLPVGSQTKHKQLMHRYWVLTYKGLKKMEE